MPRNPDRRGARHIRGDPAERRDQQAEQRDRGDRLHGVEHVEHRRTQPRRRGGRGCRAASPTTVAATSEPPTSARCVPASRQKSSARLAYSLAALKDRSKAPSTAPPRPQSLSAASSPIRGHGLSFSRVRASAASSANASVSSQKPVPGEMRANLVARRRHGARRIADDDQQRQERHGAQQRLTSSLSAAPSRRQRHDGRKGQRRCAPSGHFPNGQRVRK